jgi:hypothetical protein
MKWRCYLLLHLRRVIVKTSSRIYLHFEFAAQHAWGGDLFAYFMLDPKQDPDQDPKQADKSDLGIRKKTFRIHNTGTIT